jgi:Leucine-rich repeat (LRR) protein
MDKFRKISLLVFGFFLVYSLNAQCTNCNSFEEAFVDPENVIKLNYSGALNEQKLDSIPNQISTLKNLKFLYLSANNISKIPKEIIHLKKLEELSLAENELTDLPDFFFELSSLKEVILVSNKFSSEVVEEIKEKFKLKLPNTKLIIDFDEATDDFQKKASRIHEADEKEK